MPKDLLANTMTMITMNDLPQAGQDILAGKIKGRLVVDIAGS